MTGRPTKPKGKLKDVNLNVRIEPGLAGALNDIAERTDLPVAHHVREAIRDYISKKAA